MKKLNLKLKTKITTMMIIVIFTAILFITISMVSWTSNNIQSKVEINIMNIANIVANEHNIINALERKDANKTIQAYIEIMLKSISQVEMIVVADMDGIRYSHPNPLRIGQKFVGGDEARVLKNSETYISQAVGTLGGSIRAFVPIYNEKNIQIGFVMVGALTQSIDKAKQQAISTVVALSALIFFIGIVASLIITDDIKADLLGLEPNQIAKLYIEKNAILDNIHEGIIAIDENKKITLVNDSAIKILNIDENKKDVIGKNVLDVFPTSQLVNILENGVEEYNVQQLINDTIVMTNRVPIKVGNKIVGAISTFRDKTMVVKLAEEITGVKQVIDALRANTHEFKNKLHVILGLIQMEELEEAKKYIVNIASYQQQITDGVINKIKDPAIAGLLLGKFNRSKELGIQIAIDENSNLEKRCDRINNNMLITIIGNIVENAMEAVSEIEIEKRKIYICIKELSDKIEINVEDTGIGIKEDDINNIFKRGFTTKQGTRGVGLALVKEVVEALKGEVVVCSKFGKGTRIIVVLPKEA